MPPSYIRVRAVVWAYGCGQTDRQTHTRTQTRRRAWPQYILRRLLLTQNVIMFLLAIYAYLLHVSLHSAWSYQNTGYIVLLLILLTCVLVQTNSLHGVYFTAVYLLFCISVFISKIFFVAVLLKWCCISRSHCSYFACVGPAAVSKWVTVPSYKFMKWWNKNRPSPLPGWMS